MGSMYTYKEVIDRGVERESWCILWVFIVQLLILMIVLIVILVDKDENDRKEC